MPGSYLARFADSGLLIVGGRGRKMFTASPANVALECGFHKAPKSDGGNSSHVEELLATIDDAAVSALRSIDKTGRPPVTGARRSNISFQA